MILHNLGEERSKMSTSLNMGHCYSTLPCERPGHAARQHAREDEHHDLLSVHHTLSDHHLTLRNQRDQITYLDTISITNHFG